MAAFTRIVLLVLVFLSGCNWLDSENPATNLADLNISVGQLEPEFSSSILEYTATVPGDTDSITLTLSSSDTTDTATVNGVPVNSMSGSIVIPLNPGANTITVVVSSADQARTRTYTVVVTRTVMAYSVGGTVSGLSGALTLQNNAGDDLVIDADGAFEFATSVIDGDDYAVTVSVQPDGQSCSVTNAAGTVVGADVSDVSVNCVDDVAQTYTVGGSVGGLIGSMTLQNNGADDLTVNAIGSFSFATAMADGTAYAVTVSSQPAGQLCIVSNGAGTISGANVNNVSVSCSGIVVPTYTVGGTVSGLTGNVTLQNNGADDLPIAADGPFAFSTVLIDGSTYAVTVSTQPDGQTCAVSNGGGTVSGVNVSNVGVTCIDNVVPTYTVGGTVSGLTGNVTLQNNGADDLPIAADGPFAFSTALIDGSTYAVTVSTQPDGQTCTVSNAGGTVSGVNVSNVGVSCVDNVVPTYFVRITVSGLTGSMRLQNNGGDDLIVGSNGPNAFATALDDGSAYAVTVSVQPDGQTCTVTNGSGTIAGADVADISVNCADNIVYSVGGTVSGLTSTVTLQNNAADDLNVGANGSFTFPTAVDDGSAYSVSVGAQPAGQLCSVTNGAGTIAGANVTNVSVDCVDTGGGTISNWKWANPLPQGNSIGDIAWNGSQWVAVGEYGTILTSPDGLSWTSRDAGTVSSFSGIVWDGGQFVVVGSEGTVLTSPDGATWTGQTSGTTNFMTDIVWSGSQFVAVGYGLGQQVLTSPDGIAWTTRSAVAGYLNMQSVAWNGSLFVAVTAASAGEVYTSPDGVVWTRVYLGAYAAYSVATDGSQFVVTGSSVIYRSIDGAVWTMVEQSAGLSQIFAVTWDGNQFLAARAGGIYSSPDGVNWTLRVIDNLGGFLNVIVGNGSQYLAAGSAVFNSPDAVAWTLQTSGEFVWGLYDVVWSGTQFVAVGNSIVLTSPDGVVWTRRDQGYPEPFPNNRFLEGVDWNGDTFVAVGSGGSIIVSSDGATWTPVVATTSSLTAVAWGASQFVAVGGSGAIITSPEGLNWTVQTSDFDGTGVFNDISWNGSFFVAVGYETVNYIRSIIVTSPDGVTWTSQSHDIPDYRFLNGITWNGGQFVAVAYGVIVTSPDGITWTVQTAGVPDTMDLKAVIWSGSQFVAVGADVTVLTSPDGVTWTSQNSISGGFYGVTSDGDQVVVVGEGGRIITNDTL